VRYRAYHPNRPRIAANTAAMTVRIPKNCREHELTISATRKLPL